MKDLQIFIGRSIYVDRDGKMSHFHTDDEVRVVFEVNGREKVERGKVKLTGALLYGCFGIDTATHGYMAIRTDAVKDMYAVDATPETVKDSRICHNIKITAGFCVDMRRNGKSILFHDGNTLKLGLVDGTVCQGVLDGINAADMWFAVKTEDGYRTVPFGSVSTILPV